MIVEKLKVYDCRFCSHYQHDRENSEVQIFKCLKGHFDFVENDDGKISGEYKDSSPFCSMSELPCGGEDFDYGPTNLVWIRLAEQYNPS